MSKIYNVKDYGVMSDGKKLITPLIQKLIDSIDEGKIFFPKGEYVLSTIFLKSNVSFVFEEGAKILGAESFYDYCQQEKIDYPIYQDQSHTYFDCSMFVGRGVKNVTFEGKGIIDMRSVWDEDNVRDIVHRGPKCIALKECRNITIKDLTILNATDLAVYFAGCENVYVGNMYLKVYIDGISPDCSKNVLIENCFIESGDDAIVFKSSFTLNRFEDCSDIEVRNCNIRCRCNAIKFGTESNGGFKNISVQDILVQCARITGVSIETVDGANIENIQIKNVEMHNVGAPFFVHIGRRMRGPEKSLGTIDGLCFENIKLCGDYSPYDIVPWNYISFTKKDYLQYPWVYDSYIGLSEEEIAKRRKGWQFSSNVTGLKESHIKNVKFKNIDICMDGGIEEYIRDVPETGLEYPEVNVYGKILPAKGIYFRYVDGVSIENFKVTTNYDDVREDFVFDNVNNIEIK